MLISCYQCRNQLEVSPDSAGKRVRCPHCEHVIVVPGAKSADNATALPSLELDDAYAATPAAAPSAPPTTSLPPLYPLPPIELPAKASAPLDEPPPPPSVERGGRRRLPRQPQPEKRGWGRVVWICLGLGAVACLLPMCIWGGNWGAKPKPKQFAKVAVKLPPPPPPPPPPIFVPPLKVEPFIPPVMVVLQWQNHQDFTRRFRAQFPGVPAKRNQEINGAQMAALEVKQGEWEFAIAHRTMTDKEYTSIPAFDRFAGLERFLRNQVNALNIQQMNQPAAGANQVREWQITEHTGRMSFVRVYFARDGDRWHHYLLKAKGPIFAHRFHADILRFFDSFHIDITTSNDNSHLGETLVGELDNLNVGGRRDKEFTAFAQHPTRPIVALGTSTGWVTVFWTNQERAPANFMPGAGKPVEQVALSKDGKWLATAANGEIQTWLNWDTLANKSSVMPGLACKFTRDDRLLIVSKNQIKEYDPETRMFANTTEVPDVDVHGLALSSDGSRLAVFGKKHILLWDWTTKKLLGNIEAHDKPITTVAFSPDSQTLASASADRTIKLWDADTFAPRPPGEGARARATLRQHAWTVASLAFHPDGTKLISAGVDGMLLVWDVQPKQPTLLWAQANRFPVRAIEADKEHLYLTCKHPWHAQPFDGKQWLNMFRKVAWTEMKPNPKEAEKLVAQNAGLHIASPASTFFCGREGEPSVTVPNHLEGAFDQRKARVWDATSGSLRHEIPCMIGGLLSPDGRWLVFSAPQGNVLLQLLDLQTNTVLPRRELLDVNFLPQMMFSADSKYLWVHQKHECVRYEVPTLTIKQRVKLKEPNDPRFVSIVASHDQRMFLASTSAVGGLRRRTLYHSDTGMSVPLPKPDGAPSSFLKIRRFGQMIELEDTLHGTSQVFGQQRNTLQAWAIHPEVKLAAADDTGNVHLWDLVERKPILTLPAPSTRAAVAMRFSADGRLFSYTTNNGWTRVVPLDWLLERKGLLPSNANDVAAP